jgi:hypothetical protein
MIGVYSMDVHVPYSDLRFVHILLPIIAVIGHDRN